MAYSPHTHADRRRMLDAVGVAGVDDLFADIAAPLRCTGLPLPPPRSEQALAAHMRRLASRNRVELASFLGAGVYPHYVPALVDQLLLRGEFYTAYTPYQPEISQGTLQSVYEYQSLVAELTGLDVVSASHYDGATATAEAALMAVRATRRGRVVVSGAVHPHYRQTLAAYLAHRFSVDVAPVTADGRTDAAALEAQMGDDVAAIVVAQPNFLGVLGRFRPGDAGFDAMHFNLHKTFSTPHGGGGPGAGPVGVAAKLEPYLPWPRVMRDGAAFRLEREGERPAAVGRMRSFAGNTGVLVRAYAYIYAHGAAGLRQVADDAVLTANYLQARLRHALEVPFDRHCQHEFVASAKRLRAETGVRTLDVAKRLIDFGFHPRRSTSRSSSTRPC